MAPLIDQISMCAVPLIFIRRTDAGQIGSALATGFLWKDQADWFLITNWHNVTGMHPQILSHLSSFTPTHVTLELKYEVSKNAEGQIIGTKRYTTPLYGDVKPLWLEHPDGRKVDCVALAVAIPEESKLANRPVNEIEFDDIYRPAVGDDCFIIGFPKGLTGSGKTPIWKKGSIASEPNLDIAGEPLVLVDSATRQGMSGSPVVARHSGIHTSGRELTGSSIFGTAQSFLGIYSGRTDDDELGLQIGRVWKAGAVRDVIYNGVRGDDPIDLAYPPT